MSAPSLSKSRYLAGHQCDLRLWYQCYQRELAAPTDPVTQSIFDVGHAVGALAQQRYPGGRLVEWDHQHPDEAVAQTAALLADPGVSAIFEAAFVRDGVLVRADVLDRGRSGAWNLIEVKSSTKLEDVYLLDLALQTWVLEGAGVRLGGTGVLTLNRGYLYKGGELDLDALFVLHDQTLEVRPLVAQVGDEVAAMHRMLAADAAPQRATGEHCSRPYACPFITHCTAGADVPENPVTDLPNLRAAGRQHLAVLGIETIEDIPVDYELNPLQQVVRDAVVRGSDTVHGDLGQALRGAEAPVHYLDFETVAPAVPKYPGTHPYDLVPFQFSVHRDGEAEHLEYLHPDDTDPRQALAEALLSALGERGSICVYTGFEARVIGDLAMALPDLAVRLRALLGRLWDLHAAIRSTYYHPEFHGSFSIKAVLPALVPEMTYDQLAIGDGRLAGVRYLEALQEPSSRAKIFDDLRTYCGHDTLAMVRVREWLAARAA